jgi:recombinational DNA repair protein RecR
MSRFINKFKKRRRRALSPNHTLRAPPYDRYSAFQPAGYAKLYHNCEEAKMKKNYQWIYSDLRDEQLKKELKNNEIQEVILLIKKNLENAILSIQDYINKKIEDLRFDWEEIIEIG